MTATLPARPSCPRHGPMELRTGPQTREQLWCGTWFDCTEPRCRTSGLVPSAELATGRVGR